MYELVELNTNDCSPKPHTITEAHSKESIAGDHMDEHNWNKYVVPIAQDNLTAQLGDIISKYIEPPRYYGLSNTTDPYICEEKKERIIWDMNIGAISVDVGERPYFSKSPVAQSDGVLEWSSYGMEGCEGAEQILTGGEYSRFCDRITECFPERMSFMPRKEKAFTQNHSINRKPLITDEPIPANLKQKKRIRKMETMKACTICNKTVRLLPQHMKRQHGINKQPMECPICGKDFPTNYKLKMHIPKCR